TVRDLVRVHLDNAELAYLSACETAYSDPPLADEAVHLATAFQLAGFRHVIANLWPITDEVAERISHLFYEAMRGDDHPAADHAAVALHTATRTLRNRYPEQHTWWTATIHVGP